MTSPFHEPTHRHVLVLLDPTHLMGETALHYVNGIISRGDRVTLAVWPVGPSARALVDFATDDDRSVSEIADLYLEQAVDRVQATSADVDTLVLPGADLADALLGVVVRSDLTELVLPATVAGSVPGVESRIALQSGLPVTVANGQLRRRIA